MYDSFSEGRMYYGRTTLFLIGAVVVSVLLKLV